MGNINQKNKVKEEEVVVYYWNLFPITPRILLVPFRIRVDLKIVPAALFNKVVGARLSFVRL